jgi:hypothetical protein
MNEKTKLVVQIAMTEYMILMAGALLLYLAQALWPHALGVIALVGGLSVGGCCIGNFWYILRMHEATHDASPRRPRRFK